MGMVGDWEIVLNRGSGGRVRIGEKEKGKRRGESVK